MLGDVGDPQPVGLVAPEPPLDEVAGRRDMWDPPKARTSGHAGDPGAAHQQLDRAAADLETMAQGEFGVDSTSSVGAAAVEVERTSTEFGWIASSADGCLLWWTAA